MAGETEIVKKVYDELLDFERRWGEFRTEVENRFTKLEVALATNIEDRKRKATLSKTALSVCCLLIATLAFLFGRGILK